MIIDSFLPLIGRFLSSDLWRFFFVPFIALCFLATVPCIIRYFFRVR